jgi:AcrR family transcriptional regulator
MSKTDTSDLAARRGYHHGNLREALVAAARQLSAEKGPHGFTMAEAARLAGVSPSAPYRHFKDRDALMAELCRRGFEEFARRLTAALTSADGRAALTQMGRTYLAFAREDPGTYAAMFSYRPDAPRAGTGTTPEQDPSFGPLIAALGSLLPEDRRDGTTLRLLALEVWALSHGMAGLERAGLPGPGSSAPPAEVVLDDAVGRLLRGA